MGRKSNTKKKVRELLKEEEEVEQGVLSKLSKTKGKKKQAKEELKKKIKDKSEKDLKGKEKNPKKKKVARKSLKEHFHTHKHNIFAGTFTVIMLALLVSVGQLIFIKAFKPVDIAKYLPSDNTILSVEFNLDTNHSQVTRALELTSNSENFNQGTLESVFNEIAEFNYSDLSNWLGRSAGLAILNSSKTESGLNILTFAEVSNQENLLTFLKSKRAAVSTYNAVETYLVDEKIYLTQIDKYLFAAGSQKEIFELIDHQDAKKLYNSSRYRRVDDNLPLNKLAFLYIDFDQISDNLFTYFDFLSAQGLSIEQLKPMLSVFESEGVAFISLEDNFAIQSFLSLNEDLIDESYSETFDVKYQADLANYISSEAIAFWGGYDLSDQIERYLAVLSGDAEESRFIFAGLAQSLTEKYFGIDVNFHKDLLPLMDKEFIYALEPVIADIEDEQSDIEFVHKFVFHLDFPTEERNKIFELANNFATLGAVFEPRIIETVLKDGTIAKELVAIPEQITTKDTEYKEQSIQNLIMGQQDWGISYAIVDDIAIISTSEEAVKKSIDLIEDSTNSLRQSEAFASQIQPVLLSADEVSYFKISQVVSHFFPELNLPFIQDLDSLSSGRNYFNDGIVTIDYLKVQ